MSVLASQDILRSAPAGLKRWLTTRLTAAIPFGFRILRQLRPIARLGGTYIVTRHDDVREVFLTDAAFQVPYKLNLDVITGGEPFFLGMADTPDYHAGVAAMRRVFRANDLPGLAQRMEQKAEQIVAGSAGRIEVVGELVRRTTFEVLAAYFGVTEPALGRLDVWATRLFEFQFASAPGDLTLRAEAEQIAPAFRAHIDAAIARRKAGNMALDDVLGRCLALQAAGEEGFRDVQIRTAILCMIVGGPPQPPMVVPQALEQLLLRPDALRAASAAATTDDDAMLQRMVREAMRFDPLAPGLPRLAVKDWTVARGTDRERIIPKGAPVIAAFASAMMDDRRVASPGKFDPNRSSHEYLHFGCGLHECFGRHINEATLHRMLKPLLRRPGIRRAVGPEGRLSKNGPFAERLVVEFDLAAPET